MKLSPKAIRWSLLGTGILLGLIAGLLLHNLHGPHPALLNSKLLDWPFLTFVLITSLVMLFYDSIYTALNHRELTIAWGKDQQISIKQLSSAVSGELDPLQEEIEALKLAVAKLQAQGTTVAPPTPGQNSSASAQTPAEPYAEHQENQLVETQRSRIREALMSPKYKWRTIQRLATIIGATEDDALSLLLTMNDVRLSRSMTGHQIAGLRERVGKP